MICSSLSVMYVCTKYSSSHATFECYVVFKKAPERLMFYLVICVYCIFVIVMFPILFRCLHSLFNLQVYIVLYIKMEVLNSVYLCAYVTNVKWYYSSIIDDFVNLTFQLLLFYYCIYISRIFTSKFIKNLIFLWPIVCFNVYIT